jgi:hypothetical protein
VYIKNLFRSSKRTLKKDKQTQRGENRKDCPRKMYWVMRKRTQASLIDSSIKC